VGRKPTLRMWTLEAATKKETWQKENPTKGKNRKKKLLGRSTKIKSSTASGTKFREGVKRETREVQGKKKLNGEIPSGVGWGITKGKAPKSTRKGGETRRRGARGARNVKGTVK